MFVQLRFVVVVVVPITVLAARVTAYSAEGMGGESDDGDGGCFRTVFQVAGGVPSVHDGETHIHENEVGQMAGS